MPPPAISQPKLALATAKSLLWPWFLAWTALACFVLPFGIGTHHAETWISNPGLRGAVAAILGAFDTLWIILAAANVYVFAMEREGREVARCWGIGLVLALGALSWIGATTGFPFGSFTLMARLGLRLGTSLSLAAVLLWLTLLLASRYTALAFFPRARGWNLALGAAALVVLSDLNLEPIAWNVRSYWWWYPQLQPPDLPSWPPLQNFLAWGVIAFLLTLWMDRVRASRPVPPRPGPGEAFPLKPLLILAMLNGVWLWVHLSRFLKLA